MCKLNGNGKNEEILTSEELREEPLLIYCKPLHFYFIIANRARSHPSFLKRTLGYQIEAKRNPGLESAHKVAFNYHGIDGVILKTEFTPIDGCLFCLSICGSFKGLKHHLTSCHDIFEYEFLPSGGGVPRINVSVNVALCNFAGRESNVSKDDDFIFCRKPRKRHGTATPRRFNVSFLPLDTPDVASDTENGFPLLFNGYRSLGNSEVAANFEPYGNTAPAIPGSSLESDARAVLPTEAVPTPTKAKKSSSEQSEARSNLLLQRRQFYHSHTNQPMSFEEVMNGPDSEDEVDEDVADLEDRQMLDDFVDVSKEEKHIMHLWNSFTRRQRVIADGHVPWACEAFSILHGQELARCNALWRFWRVFLVRLWDQGLVNAVTINNCNLTIEKFENNADSDNNNTTVMDHQDDIDNNNNNTSTVMAHQDDIDNNNNNNTVMADQDDNNIDHADVDKDGK